VKLGPDQVNSAGIVIGAVGPREMVTTFELPGEVKMDGTRSAHVVPRLQGVVTDVLKKEGDRVRLQAFEGVVIAIRHRGFNSAFTVRKISYGEGVERVFQTHSPSIANIKIKRRGDVRRAKLYYMRERAGKSARIKEKIKVSEE